MRNVLSEELKNMAKCVSIAFDRSNVNWAKPKPLYKQKRENKSEQSEMSSLFFC